MARLVRLEMEFGFDDFFNLFGVRSGAGETDRPETSDRGLDRRRTVAVDRFLRRGSAPLRPADSTCIGSIAYSSHDRIDIHSCRTTFAMTGR